MSHTGVNPPGTAAGSAAGTSSDPAGPSDPARPSDSAGAAQTPGAATPRGGLRDGLAALAGLLVSAVHTRLELAAADFTVERERTRARLVLLMVAAVALGFALLAANVIVMLALWDQWRTPGLTALMVVYLVIAALAAWRLSVMGQREQRPFDTTLRELERDRAWLTSRLGGRR